jgi:hypothetical protein
MTKESMLSQAQAGIQSPQRYHAATAARPFIRLRLNIRAKAVSFCSGAR